MYQRLVESRLREALANTPAVLLTGPRRAGKTTLARLVCENGHRYATLDGHMDFKRATKDPIEYIRDFDHAIIAEIQRIPELFRAIKKSVDEDPRPGRFLLTSSANVHNDRQMGDSMVGRIQHVNLLPLAQSEINGSESTFLERLFEGKFENSKAQIVGDDLIELVMTGGYPENIGKNERQRKFWAESYMDFILTRDIIDIATIDKLANFPDLIRSLAVCSGQLVNFSRLGSYSGLDYHTVQRYIALLERTFIVSLIKPWHKNMLNRMTKSPKIHFLDNSLLLTANQISIDYVKRDRDKFGHFLESFVYSEILKLLPTLEMQLTPYHYRDAKKREVDIVLEREDGMIVGIKVMASATVRPKDFSGLRDLSEACGEKFAHGIILFDSVRYVPYGEKFSAAPISSMWE